MATCIGMNGFGRIGRQSLKAILERHGHELEVVAINDLTDTKTNAHLLKYDTTYGRFPGEIAATSDSLLVNGQEIKVLTQRDPAHIPWSDLGVESVVESTGFFTDATKATAHLHGTVKKVLISAPAKGEDLTVVLDTNSHDWGSCTLLMNDEFIREIWPHVLSTKKWFSGIKLIMFTTSV
jgi:glyceraldehyde 3-phosphate dehydrogenase